MAELNQVVEEIEVASANIESIIAAMKQTNTNMVPLRQQILVMWRDNLSVGLDSIIKCIEELKEFEYLEIKEKSKPKKVVPKFSIRKKNNK